MEQCRIKWNMASTLEQLGGDLTLLQEVMAIFMSEAPQHLEALGLAVDEGNAEKIETMAHTMKGELGYLGVPDISRMARELEEMGRSRNVEHAANLFSLFAADVSGLFHSVRSSGAISAEPAASSSSAVRTS